MTQQITLVLAGLEAEITALITDKVDAGTTNPEGILRIKSGAGTPLVDIVLANPAFAAGIGSIRDLLTVPLQGTATASGTAALAEMLDRDLGVVFTGTVSVLGGGSFLSLDKIEIEIGDVITVQSLTVQYP